MKVKFVAATLATALAAPAQVFSGEPTPVGYTIVTPTGFGDVTTADNGGTRTTIIADDGYDKPIELITVRGSRHDMGYDLGQLSCKEIKANYNSLLDAMLGDDLSPGLKAAAKKLVGMVADWQWDDYLSVQVPQQYMDELAGLQEGCEAVGVADGGAMASRSIVVANLPSDMDDLLIVLADELLSSQEDKWVRRRAEANAALQLRGEGQLEEVLRSIDWLGMGCSFGAAWGSRTENGDLLSMRNLDWTADTGVNKHKVVTVYVPDDGATAHATIGFAGLFGALVGMSADGFTVHEANLEESQDSFRGFPWVLRLRWIMEEASTLAEAQELWEASNNTVGFNHMVASAGERMALAMETQAGYSAYFNDNDPREAAAMWEGAHLGDPMPDALWRTNHGYDPESIRNYMWNTTHAFQDSQYRYWLIHDALQTYEGLGTAMGPAEMINITSIAGSNGEGPDGIEDFYLCRAPYTGALNVLSVAFDPANLVMYPAFENGSQDTWSPACCNAYVQIDMRELFQ